MQPTITIKGDNVHRVVSDEVGSLPLPKMTIYGLNDPNSFDKAIESITKAEEAFFSIPEKFGLKRMLKTLSSFVSSKTEVANSDENVAEVITDEPVTTTPTSASKPEAPKPQRVSKAAKLEQDFSEAKQIYLHEVGYTTSGTYLGSGNRLIKSQKRFVVYLQTPKDGVCFIAGTQLQELVHRCDTGDYIEITKLEHFRKAANREHARAAIFDLTVLETASSKAA